MTHITWLAFLAPLVVFWQSARNFIKLIFSFFIRTDTMDGYFNHSFVHYMMKKGRSIKFGNIHYFRSNFYSKIHKRNHDFLFVMRPRFIILYKGYFPIIITPGSKLKITYFNVKNTDSLIAEYLEWHHNFEVELTKREGRNNRFCIGEIFGMSEKKSMLQSHQKEVSEAKASVAPITIGSTSSEGDGLGFVNNYFIDVTPPVGVSEHNISCSAPQSNTSKYYFSKEGVAVLEQVENWYNGETFFTERQINWRRGGLLYGKPGTGKSALVKEIAKKVGIPMVIFHLNTLDTEEFETAINHLNYGSIVLFEDIDTVWDENRKNKVKNGLPFDFFINKLSGANSMKNVFVFMTTNYIKKLDSALIRDGRCDFKVELPDLCQDGKRFMASRILDLWPELIEDMITDEQETAAQFENKCVTLATQKYWEDTHLDKKEKRDMVFV